MKNFLQKLLNILMMPVKILGTIFSAVFAIPIGIIDGIKEGIKENKAAEKLKKENPDISLEAKSKQQNNLEPKEKTKENALAIKEYIIQNYPEKSKGLSYSDYLNAALALSVSDGTILKTNDFEIMVCKNNDELSYYTDEGMKSRLNSAIEKAFQNLQNSNPNIEFQKALNEHSKTIKEIIEKNLKTHDATTMILDNYSISMRPTGLDIKFNVLENEKNKIIKTPNMAIRYAEKDISYWKEQLKVSALEAPYRIAMLRECPEIVTDINTDIANKIQNNTLTPDDLMVMNYIVNNRDEYPEISSDIAKYEDSLEFLSGLSFTDTLPELVAEKHALKAENDDLSKINQEIDEFVANHINEFELLEFNNQYNKIPDYIATEINESFERMEASKDLDMDLDKTEIARMNENVERI